MKGLSPRESGLQQPLGERLAEAVDGQGQLLVDDVEVLRPVVDVVQLGRNLVVGRARDDIGAGGERGLMNAGDAQRQRERCRQVEKGRDALGKALLGVRARLPFTAPKNLHGEAVGARMIR